MRVIAFAWLLRLHSNSGSVRTHFSDRCARECRDFAIRSSNTCVTVTYTLARRRDIHDLRQYGPPAVSGTAIGVCHVRRKQHTSFNMARVTRTSIHLIPQSTEGLPLAVALFDSGSSIGAAVAPGLVLWLYHSRAVGGRRFILTGRWGSVLLAWRWLLSATRKHPRISPAD